MHGQREAVLHVLPVAATRRGSGLQQAPRDPDQEGRGEQEGGGVEPVSRVDPCRGGERSAGDGTERPGQVVGALEQRVGGGEIAVLNEIRQPCVDRRPEETRGHADDSGQHHDLGRARRERQDGEGSETDEVGVDHQAPPREPVDERADEQPDREGRKQVGDQERRDPGGRAGSLVDVDLERDERQPRPGAGADRCEEEPRKARLASEQP